MVLDETRTTFPMIFSEKPSMGEMILEGITYLE
jgi:hypothetical protein